MGASYHRAVSEPTRTTLVVLGATSSRERLKPETESSHPASINSPARRALFDNLEKDEDLAVRVDTTIRYVKKVSSIS